jgi:UDP-N-acetylglucosamine acyltransferase
VLKKVFNVIDERAVIDPRAKLGKGVHVGPYTTIGPDVEIGEGTWIGPHVVINGPCRIGTNNRIYQFASVGEDPQDKKFKAEKTWLLLGNDNVIREFCTIHRSAQSLPDTATRIGDNNYFMAYVHIAHDCHIANHTIFNNCANIAGHVHVDDYAILGAFTGVHQFARIGAHSFISKNCMVLKDILPFTLVAGHDAKTYGLNTIGLRRRGFSSSTILNLRRAYKIICRQGLLVSEAIAKLQPMLEECPEIQFMIESLQSSERGIVR